MDKSNTKNVTVESNENTNEVETSLELEVRRSRKVRTGLKAGLASVRTNGRGPITV